MSWIQTAWDYLTRDDLSLTTALKEALPQRRAKEARATKGGTAYMSDPAAWLYQALHGKPSYSGVVVDEKSLLGIPAIYASVKVISETVASLPLIVFRRDDDGGKARAKDSALYRVLHEQANPYMSAFRFKETMQANLCIYNRAYARIYRNGAGEVVQLVPLPTSKVEVTTRNGQRYYKYQKGPTDVELLPAKKVFHVAGLSLNGSDGMSLTGTLDNAFGSVLATDEFAARFFSNDSTPGGVLESPKELSDSAYKRLKASWESKHRSVEDKHRVAVLENGITWKPTSTEPEKAQLLQTRQFQLAEMARVFRMQPHMIQDLSRSTYSNIEQQSLEFVRDTIRPWLIRWEQDVVIQLIPESQRDELFAEFLIDALLRADFFTRMQGYRIAMEIGILSANEIREMENRNHRDEGDTYYYPANWQPEGAPPVTGFREQRDLATDRFKTAAIYRDIFAATYSKIARREAADVRRSSESMLQARDLEEFETWLREYFTGDLSDWARQQLEPVYMSLAKQVQREIIVVETDQIEAFRAEYIAAAVARYLQASLGTLIGQTRRAAEEDGNVVEVLGGALDTWPEKRGRHASMLESTRASNAFAKSAYLATGAAGLVWVTTGKSTCPYCQRMAGAKVGMTDSFVYDGEVKPGPDGQSMEIYRNVGHPPLHLGCDCQVVAG